MHKVAQKKLTNKCHGKQNQESGAIRCHDKLYMQFVECPWPPRAQMTFTQNGMLGLELGLWLWLWLEEKCIFWLSPLLKFNLMYIKQAATLLRVSLA